ALTGGTVRLEPAALAEGRGGRQVYEVDGIVGVPAEGHQLRAERRDVQLVPFADLVNGRVWIARAGRIRGDRPAVTAFSRASLSVVSLGLEPTAKGPRRTDIAEFVTDEDPHSFCTVNPQDFGLANYLGSPRRSEEHTSELQSHLNLVCRLLLEKKKKKIRKYIQLNKK